jgi:hypothetical protein
MWQYVKKWQSSTKSIGNKLHSKVFLRFLSDSTANKAMFRLVFPPKYKKYCAVYIAVRSVFNKPKNRSLRISINQPPKIIAKTNLTFSAFYNASWKHVFYLPFNSVFLHWLSVLWECPDFAREMWGLSLTHEVAILWSTWSASDVPVLRSMSGEYRTVVVAHGNPTSKYLSLDVKKNNEV